MKFCFVQAHIETARLYSKMYGESYYSSGCAYRGLPPEREMVEETEDQRRVVCARLYLVLLEHMEVCIKTNKYYIYDRKRKNITDITHTFGCPSSCMGNEYTQQMKLLS